jgi:hypothetical protein
LRRRWQEVLSADTGLTVLLVSLVAVLFVIYPFVPLNRPGRVLVSLALTVVLVAGGFSLGDRRRLRAVVIALAAVAVASRWLSHVGDLLGLRILFHLSTLLFLALNGGGVLAKVLRGGRVTPHRIQGAIAVYLLLGLTCAFGYSLIELLEPGSFQLPPAVAADGARMGDFVYFSFVTLTSLGYGDVQPASSSARTLAILEALAGQLYLAILVARLVALQIAHSRKE